MRHGLNTRANECRLLPHYHLLFLQDRPSIPKLVNQYFAKILELGLSEVFRLVSFHDSGGILRGFFSVGIACFVDRDASSCNLGVLVLLLFKEFSIAHIKVI